MPTYGDAYPMVLNNVFLGMISIRSDQKRYFGILDPTAEELAFVKYVGEVAGYSKNIYSERLDSTSPTRTITVDKKTGIQRERGKTTNGRGGRAIKIPTELTNTPPSRPTTNAASTVIRRPQVRYTIMRFPNGASMGEISAWLHLKLVSHKPKIMISPGGKTYSVSPFSAGAQATGQNVIP